LFENFVARWEAAEQSANDSFYARSKGVYAHGTKSSTSNKIVKLIDKNDFYDRYCSGLTLSAWMFEAAQTSFYRRLFKAALGSRVAAGIDGVTPREFLNEKDHFNSAVNEVEQFLRSDCTVYRWSKSKLVQINTGTKKKVKARTILISTCKDQVVSYCLNLCMAPVVERMVDMVSERFGRHISFFGSRIGKSAFNALSKIRSQVNLSKCSCFTVADVANCFPSISLEMLRGLVIFFCNNVSTYNAALEYGNNTLICFELAMEQHRLASGSEFLCLGLSTSGAICNFFLAAVIYFGSSRSDVMTPPNLKYYWHVCLYVDDVLICSRFPSFNRQIRLWLQSLLSCGNLQFNSEKLKNYYPTSFKSDPLWSHPTYVHNPHGIKFLGWYLAVSDKGLICISSPRGWIDFGSIKRVWHNEPNRAMAMMLGRFNYHRLSRSRYDVGNFGFWRKMLMRYRTRKFNDAALKRRKEQFQSVVSKIFSMSKAFPSGSSHSFCSSYSR
jgi:hypothetical protein